MVTPSRLGLDMPSGGSSRLLRAAEAADFLNVSERTFREYWRKWGITAFRVGRALRFRERDLNNWLQAHSEAP
jgi:excisionase family DNA binding protein